MGATPDRATKFVEFTEEHSSWKPAEEALIDKMIEDLRCNNEFQYRKSVKRGKPHAIRDAHAKSCAILYGELTVNDNLPEEYRQGLFSTPGRTYPVIARISATSGAIRSDRVRGVRGLGLKILGVESQERAHADFMKDNNQDFVFVTEPEFLFKDAADYATGGMRTAKILARMPDAAMIVANTVLRGARRVADALGKQLHPKLRVFSEPNHHPLGQTFYTAAPVRYGKYIAKISVSPLSAEVDKLRKQTLRPGSDHAASDAVTQHFGSHGAEYAISAQLCTDTTEMPLDDATVPWSEKKSPYHPVGVIRYPKQTAYSEDLKTFGDDRLTFNSWRGIIEHTPLGSINRLKLRVYAESSKFRHQRNQVPDYEPADLSDFPDCDLGRIHK
ncbi:catalase family protein [Mycolicibacterium sp. BiH015]|uniref:catalase family protein n=1 Tax=Mycolicibacterium sp. BiH015 TaxID=3018808 RepID=UPI0022E355EB|nr:catalase family protein [Mycolicibacterium sp. BiH015]MDA2893839.1 catalase family protein [Mycolicibacterium sp. BiH015]